MLPKFSAYKRVFLETTKSDHAHGGPGWEFGKCLWSPVRNAGGSLAYQVMKEAKPCDLILHNYKYSPDGKPSRPYLCGISIVAKPASITTEEPPIAGDWSGRGEYYRIELTDYQQLDSPLDFGVFTKSYVTRLAEQLEHNVPKFFPFTVSGGFVRYNQGMYLTKIPGQLYALFEEAFGVESSNLNEKEKEEIHKTYEEGERARREVAYFQRHPDLSKDAKKHYNYTCQLCGFQPRIWLGDKHKDVGLDCHHLNPLSERVGAKKGSTLNEVTILCAICHRLVHSKKPALSLDQAAKLLPIKPVWRK